MINQLLQWLQSPLPRRLIIFAIVGGLAFLLDVLVVSGLLHLGVNLYACRAISLVVVVLFTFVMNRWATFGQTGVPELSAFTAYVIASLLGLGINYTIFAALTMLYVPWLPAMALGTLLSAAFNFLSYGRIFGSRSGQA